MSGLKSLFSKINELLKRFNITSVPRILSGYQMMLSGKEEIFFGFAYPLPEDYRLKFDLLTEKGLNPQQLPKHNIQRDVKDDDVNLKLIGGIGGYYIYKGVFDMRFSHEDNATHIMITSILNEGISVSEFINIYEDSLKDFIEIMDKLEIKVFEEEISMIFWTELNTDISMDLPDFLEKKGIIQYDLNDKEIIARLENILGKKFGKHDIYLEKGKITDLDIRNVPQLDIIPNLVFSLKNLTRLVIENTSITKIPIGIKKLANLRILNIETGKIKKIPEELCNLKELVNLSLINNELEEIPNYIINLKQLKTLNLEGNNVYWLWRRSCSV